MLNRMVEYSPGRLDGVYGALANVSRRGLVDRLSTSPARVTDLADSFSMSLAGVSKHIRVLEAAGLIRREVRGREHLISLEPAPLADADHWLAGYRRFWADRLDLLDRRLRERG
jgi:DNA-binding transcriptional ArsR family regulator